MRERLISNYWTKTRFLHLTTVTYKSMHWLQCYITHKSLLTHILVIISVRSEIFHTVVYLPLSYQCCGFNREICPVSISVGVPLGMFERFTVCKLNPDSEVGNTFIFVWWIYWRCVWACHVTQYHSNVKNKSVANLTVRIEFTCGT